MKNITPFYKHAGETPLLAVTRFRKENNISDNQKIAYAGRLDPLAEGVLLLIKGDELKNFNNHLYHDKEYEATILFGFKTDTYDVMGLPTEVKPKKELEVKALFDNREGEIFMSLPPFSSYKINGKPLFWWAREDRLSEISVPEKKYYIKKLELISSDAIPSSSLLDKISAKICKVHGDFRQQDIIKEWRRLLKNNTNIHSVVMININVSSGFYVRGFAHLLGRESDAGATLLDLKRTRVGDYSVNDC